MYEEIYPPINTYLRKILLVIYQAMQLRRQEHQTATTPRDHRQTPPITEGFIILHQQVIAVCIIVPVQGRLHISG